MKPTAPRFACLLLALLPLTTAQAEVADPGVPVVALGRAFTVQVPPGWVYDRSSGLIVASRDGYLLNTIAFQLRKHAKAFPALKKGSTLDTPAEELADSYVGDLKLQAGLDKVDVVSLEPAELAGHPGFKMRLSYRAAESTGAAPYESVVFGAPIESGLLLATYSAPRLNYFEKSLPAFEWSLRTLALIP